MEEGLRTPGIAAVVGETRAADPTAGRRLSLAAEKNGVPALLLRPSRRRRKASARHAGGLPRHPRPSSTVPAGGSSCGATVSASPRSKRCHPGSWSGTMKRVVSLWFPKLSTDRLARLNAKDWSARAAATVVWRDSCPRLAAVNPHARAAGLRPYMRLADSRTLVPDLVTLPVEPQADRRLIETLASWCDRYTPWVAIDPLGDARAEEGAEACSRRRLRRRRRPAARRHRLRPSLRFRRSGRARAAGRSRRAPEPARLRLPRRDGRHGGCGLGAGPLRRDAGRPLLPGQRPARRARRAAGRRIAARQADPRDLPQARPAPHRRSLSAAARAAVAPLRRPAAHPPRPGARPGRRADRAAPPAARLPHAACLRRADRPARGHRRRDQPPARRAVPAVRAGERRRAQARDRALSGSTARSTAPRSAPAGPTATTRS